MFYLNANTKPAGSEAIADRARSAGAAASKKAQSANKTAQSAAQSAQSAAQSAQSAAQAAMAAAQATAQSAALNVGSAAQTAAHDMGETVRQRVQSARGWTAPRLENAADYTTRTVAPRVSTA